ncbi:HEXXH motif-containing putative peptide modification protein [Streptomyces sp. NPDC056222]|uniref:aKG-HExxH-type peptide beta-hydroxylase n=1 Tax=Streptomyces sp. NPDC056222 TaxID=3345749 RepID=UPI0035D99784
MTTAPLSTADFAELARTGPAQVGMSALHTGLRGRRLLLLKALLVRVQRERESVDDAAARRFEAAWRLLEQAERAHPAVVRDVLDYPTTGAWLATALAAPVGQALDRRLDRLESIAVTAALRAGCPLDLTVATPTGTLSLTGAGRLHVGAERVRIRARARVVRIGPEGSRASCGALLLSHPRTGRLTGLGPAWTGLRALPGTVALLDDLDPYRVPPGGVGAPPRAATDRAATDAGAWSTRWRGAHQLLERVDPVRACEVRRVVRAVVPLSGGGQPPVPMSATLRAAPGAVLTSLPSSARAMAETLVHEIHHSKLAALHELVPLHRPGPSAVHRVGWRTDPRPIAGVLQGAYAHLALTDLWRRAAVAPRAPESWRSAAGQRFESFHDQVGGALEILLESDELTIAGREFTSQMKRHHASLGAVRRPRG